MYVVVGGSVWSVPISIAQCVIISECQKVTVLVVKAKKIGQKRREEKKLIKIARTGEKIVRKCFLTFLTKKCLGL